MNTLTNNYLEKLINTIFYQAEKGTINIGDTTFGSWKFFVKFLPNNPNTTNFDTPIVVVRNKDLLLSRLKNYLLVARVFYALDKEYFELDDTSFDEKLVMDLIINATNFDLNNFEEFISQRTAMLKDVHTVCTQSKLSTFKDCEIIVNIAKNKSNLESPYKYSICFFNGEEKFYLPSIYFARIDDQLFLYAIQGQKEKQSNKLAKQLDRYFRKVNKDVDMSDEILSQVSPTALISLVIFLAHQKSLGIKKITSFNFMPIRYNSNKSAIERKNKKDCSLLEDAIQKHDNNQFNISNRFFYTLIRYASHFDISATFNDINDSLNLDISSIKDTKETNIVHTLHNTISQTLQENEIRII